jgi:hypothetical protein
MAGPATTVKEVPALLKSHPEALVVFSLYWYDPAAVVPAMVILEVVALV